jgi:hypothetical protein
VLYRDLKNETYQIGRSICFAVDVPKVREIWAADFRDRVVHHLLYNAIRERFEKDFIADSYYGLFRWANAYRLRLSLAKEARNERVFPDGELTKFYLRPLDENAVAVCNQIKDENGVIRREVEEVLRCQ